MSDTGLEHVIEAPAEDEQFQTVLAWLSDRQVDVVFTKAVASAIEYVLDGRRTGRFDLTDPEVDSDERRTVGTKLQYHVLDVLDLDKQKPLDAVILDIPVDIKGTVSGNWTIPREAQCQLCILIEVDARNDRNRAYLMRTHRVWLNAQNQDQKRSITKAAHRRYAVSLFDWTSLPDNPLKRLTQEQRDLVFAPRTGQERRLEALFAALPNTIVPRWAIATVCFQREDPMRRARAVKDRLASRGLRLLCGTWKVDREVASMYGFDLTGEAWVALPADVAFPPDSVEILTVALPAEQRRKELPDVPNDLFGD